jgi:hypothetical protein
MCVIKRKIQSKREIMKRRWQRERERERENERERDSMCVTEKEEAGVCVSTC